MFQLKGNGPLITVALLVAACQPQQAAPESAPQRIHLTSAAFRDGAAIPSRFTCDGENRSPSLSWTGIPEEARTLVLIVEDPDAPMGLFTHWLVYNLPATSPGLEEGVPPGDSLATEPDAHQGENGFGNRGYGGPCPPSGQHRYIFRLYALDDRLDLKPGASRNDLIAAFGSHVLARGKLTGTYSRQAR